MRNAHCILAVLTTIALSLAANAQGLLEVMPPVGTAPAGQPASVPQNPPVGAPEPPEGVASAEHDAPPAVEPVTALAPAATAPEARAAAHATDEELSPPDEPSFRFAIHGYSRMPIALEGTPRAPFLVDNDYYLSGFSYTRLYETDWSELYLSVQRGDVEVALGIFASLYSDWAGIQLENQWGLAQASLRARRFAGLEPLSVQVGMFWDRLGYISPYDTYVFGRTHQGGARVAWDFPCGARLQVGFGVHREALQQNQGLTPVAHIRGTMPMGPFELGGFGARVWTRDKRQLSPIEDADLWIIGGDVRYDMPADLGPAYLAGAYYHCTRCLFLAPAIEVMHSTGGRGLTESFFGIESSNNGTGQMLVFGLDVPARLERVLPDAELRLFGMTAWVRSDQFSEDPAINRDGRLYVKWGIEPAYRLLPWLRASLRFDRVILDFDDAENSFRVLSPRVTFRVTEWGEIFLMYSRYFYGDKVTLRPGQVPLVTEPDEGVLKIQAQATF